MPLFRVLTVDDFEDFRRFLRLTLQEKAACQVIAEASDGWEAIRQAEQLNPDLVLMDIGLPILNGIEAVDEFAKFPLIPKYSSSARNPLPKWCTKSLSWARMAIC